MGTVKAGNELSVGTAGTVRSDGYDTTDGTVGKVATVLALPASLTPTWTVTVRPSEGLASVLSEA